MIAIMFSRLNDAQLNKLSDIASEIAIVALASVALPAIFEGLDLIAMVTGFITTVSFWSISLWILKNK